MSWANYSPQQPPGEPNQDPYGRDYRGPEPQGYVTHDPYAVYGQQAYPPPQQPPYGMQPSLPYAYDAAHPPRPPVGLVEAFRLFFKNYANFYGRASRAEYWYMWLWALIGYAVTSILIGLLVMLGIGLDPSGGLPAIGMIVAYIVAFGGALALFVPNLSLTVRRLHDAGFSGFFVLLSLIPYVGGLAQLVMCAMPSSPAGVKFDHPHGSQPGMR